MARQMTATSPPGRCAMSWGVNLEIGIQDSEIYWKPSSVKCHVDSGGIRTLDKSPIQ